MLIMIQGTENLVPSDEQSCVPREVENIGSKRDGTGEDKDAYRSGKRRVEAIDRKVFYLSRRV